MRLQKKILSLSIILAVGLLLAECTSKSHEKTGERKKQPKLVVGIVVDQMRYDFLYRYWNKYGKGGFKRLLREGYLCANTNINYVPTYTGPGHTAIYTGTTPSVNGIVANEWFDRETGKSVYCVSDEKYNTVGSLSKKEGQMSPENMLSSTITDELRLSDNFGSKVIGISLKDRAAILPAGHSANAAYWYDGKTGNWVTSTYYMDSLPAWVSKFNAQRQPVKFLNQKWETILPLNQYTESTKDNSEFEEPYKGETLPVFPYDLWKISANGYDLIRETPFGDTYTKNFMEEAIKQEKMGKGDFTDFIAVNLASTDYVGHRFGPNSVEIEDTYIRLDKDIEELLDFLDDYIGKDKVLVFLTADHGVVQNPGYLKSKGLPGGFFNESYIKDTLAETLKKTYHCDSLISDYENQQVYLNEKLLRDKNIPLKEISMRITDLVKTYPGVASAISSSDLGTKSYTEGQFSLVQRGFYEQRSGDVAIVLKPGWIAGGPRGTTHGSGYPYDTHIPLIFYGWKIKPGTTNAAVSVTDIAPTLAAFLQIQPPSGCTGKPIVELVH